MVFIWRFERPESNFCGVIGLSTGTDGMDDGEEFSCDMADG